MLNKTVLMGRLVRDAELRKTTTGKSVTNFTLAVDRDFKSDDGERGCDFLDVIAWGSAAELVCSYFTKGRMMCVVGRLTVRRWTDKDGKERRNTEVSAENVYFCGDRPRDDEESGSRRDKLRQGVANAMNGESVFSDDAPVQSEELPF